jgi:hypothetical protein
MTIDEILALGRVVERLLVCVFAGTSLGYGWNLFRVGIVGDQSAEFGGAGWKANLRKVGPGVFFALFGALVLVFALRSPLDLALSPGSGVAATNKYLYRLPVSAVNALDVEYRNSHLPPAEAYDRLRKLVLDSGKEE